MKSPDPDCQFFPDNLQNCLMNSAMTLFILGCGASVILFKCDHHIKSGMDMATGERNEDLEGKI